MAILETLIRYRDEFTFIACGTAAFCEPRLPVRVP